MAALTAAQKIFIIERLATFDQPSDVARAFQEEFHVTIQRQQVWIYDAGKPHMRDRMGKDLVDLFDKIRGGFLSDVAAIPIANKAFRLKQLDGLARKAIDGKATKLAASLLEQAAKECGGSYTNHHEVSGPGGAPIQVEATAKPIWTGLTSAELDALEHIATKAISAGNPSGNPGGEST